MTIEEKARDMRNVIDGIESAMMGLGDFVELPRVFDGSPDELQIAPKMTVGQMRRVCTALEECTRIINSDEYLPKETAMSAERGPEWSAEYSRGWDDCLEAIHKVLGERFPRRVSLLRPVNYATAPDVTTPEGAKKIRENANNYRDTLKPFA